MSCSQDQFTVTVILSSKESVFGISITIGRVRMKKLPPNAQGVLLCGTAGGICCPVTNTCHGSGRAVLEALVSGWCERTWLI